MRALVVEEAVATQPRQVLPQLRLAVGIALYERDLELEQLRGRGDLASLGVAPACELEQGRGAYSEARRVPTRERVEQPLESRFAVRIREQHAETLRNCERGHRSP